VLRAVAGARSQHASLALTPLPNPRKGTVSAKKHFTKFERNKAAIASAHVTRGTDALRDVRDGPRIAVAALEAEPNEDAGSAPTRCAEARRRVQVWLAARRCAWRPPPW
jgi:hypothetical protein